ncbi:lantibiotic synthetase component C-like protein [Cavenderia fasciculata]|uniref:Lantibiotic synthetase component C-like protein n=1 Tax=Cavenderia fasciculata TaxID=261658 RepID=F4QBF0_CACFS|nr:lantibiotic synthetase component C-like protein [Cavenderia fasciculata]EGG14922.1 lantibiotic synthetase component C-like protein [Cavenderia fasciculata]|eukprot:XP_004351438.1 lantibiotic synthetase component C-like protein [Cavenderia fasciculata]
MMQGRYIDNPLLDKVVVVDHHQITFQSLQLLAETQFIESFQSIDKQLLVNQPNINILTLFFIFSKRDDNSIYTGAPGLCLFYLIQYLVPTSCKYPQTDSLIQSLNRCKELYNHLNNNKKKTSSNSEKKKRITFLEGENGLLTIGIILGSIDLINDNNNNIDLKNQWIKLLNEIIIDNYNSLFESYPFELLYGKCGYIQNLLFIRKYCFDTLVSTNQLLRLDKCIYDLVDHIVEQGRLYSKQNSISSPLMYEWHHSQYLGGVHGLAGILYILMNCLELIDDESDKKLNISNDIKGSLDYLMSTRLESGNFPTRPDNTNDRLVQFCHGAPGVIPTLLKAHSFFKDSKYLECAKISSDVIWKYGLLTKGTGLCHGISGNAYSFLLIYKESKDEKDISYLWKTIEFIKLATSQSILKQQSQPDNPYSLFEGLTGLAWLLNDLINLFKYKQSYLNQIHFPTLL